MGWFDGKGVCLHFKNQGTTKGPRFNTGGVQVKFLKALSATKLFLTWGCQQLSQDFVPWLASKWPTTVLELMMWRKVRGQSFDDMA